MLFQAPGQQPRNLVSRSVAIRDADGAARYLLTISEDVTERKRIEARIAHLALHDDLTGLPNRSAFTTRLNTILAAAQETKATFSVFCVDLDRFKEVNDVFGHVTGDELLQEFARRFQTIDPDAFVARLDGDEFALVLTGNALLSRTEALADELQASASGEIALGEQRFRIGLSIGIAIYPSDGDDGATLLANASAALNRAKSAGRGTIRFFEPGMDTRLRERRAMQHELGSVIERGELELHYQPQASIDGQIIGFEALVRWRHSVRGIIPPNVFIPLAEESGLIIAMGEWILREACREAASWPTQLQIAVNLSPIQFRHGDLARVVHSVLQETGLQANRLELEITEGVLVEDFSRALSILRRLKLLGVRIAMDDFGSGYSSLSYLQAFPFDKIKIDRAFIASLGTSRQSAAIVSAMIGLARGLELPVLAEGVETADQLAFLSQASCDEIQGYFIGRPLPIAQYAAMLGRPDLADAHVALAATG
jgi:diguanylate cyclase (GGDEF)-like protein